jgi:hypothetical protein
MKLDLAGGTPIPLASAQPSPSRIAIDAMFVYWSNLDAGVTRVPLAGGTPFTFAATNGCVGIALDATRFFCTGETDGTVMKVPIEMGAPVAIASAQRTPLGIAVDESHVYWTNHVQNGAVMKIAK